MRLSAVIYCLAIAVSCCVPLVAGAEDNSYAAQRYAARRALERARIELRLYQRVEYPREQRHLDAEITLTQAEIDTYKDRLREYRPFDKFTTGGALLVPIQDLKLCLLEAELRLKDLQAERNALVRFHSDRSRLLELNVYEARVRVAELERAAEPPVADPSA